MQVQELEMDWLTTSYVGKLHNYKLFEEIRELIFLGSMSMIRIRYLGDNSIFFSGKNKVIITKIVKENVEWFENIIESIDPWFWSKVV